ncbi:MULTISPECIES: hypothetical protein [Prochlorococcus]|nr:MULTISPECIES: hypothetical protein [Prochlorococcus]KGG23304.1 hypothetical protein EV09_0928 [Prochlorococcus marinus str. SS35]KGG32461.1 hypothetical protein EV10_1576 [Prochlorococcus marinus str. SS51]
MNGYQELIISFYLSVLVFAVIFFEDSGDDDDEGGGLMQPVYQGSRS